MRITVNGEARQVAEGTTVVDLIREAGRDPDRPGVAVAVNGTVVRRGEWSSRELDEGDDVEILAAVQGGAG